MTFYHNTTEEHAQVIQASGFRDGFDGALGSGVWLTDDLDYMEDEVKLTIEIPARVMAQYRLFYEPPMEAKEWFLPATVVNTYLHTLTRIEL